MEKVLLYKKDLQKYPLHDLRSLARYLNLPVIGSRDDLAWLLAIHQSQAHKVGRMAGNGKEEDEDQWYEASVTIPIEISYDDASGKDNLANVLLDLIFIVPEYSLAKDIVTFFEDSQNQLHLEEIIQPFLDRLAEYIHGERVRLRKGVVLTINNRPITYNNNSNYKVTGKVRVVNADANVDRVSLPIGVSEFKELEMSIEYNPEEFDWFYNMVRRPTKRARMNGGDSESSSSSDSESSSSSDSESSSSSDSESSSSSDSESSSSDGTIYRAPMDGDFYSVQVTLSTKIPIMLREDYEEGIEYNIVDVNYLITVPNLELAEAILHFTRHEPCSKVRDAFNPLLDILAEKFEEWLTENPLSEDYVDTGDKYQIECENYISAGRAMTPVPAERNEELLATNGEFIFNEPEERQLGYNIGPPVVLVIPYNPVEFGYLYDAVTEQQTMIKPARSTNR